MSSTPTTTARTTTRSTTSSKMKDRGKDLHVGRSKIIDENKIGRENKKIVAKKSGKLLELLPMKECELKPENWLRQIETETDERIVNVRPTTTILPKSSLSSSDNTQKAELLMKILKTTKKTTNQGSSNNNDYSKVNSPRKSAIFKASPILFLISLILPLASSNSTPPSPQTIEGKWTICSVL